MRTEDSRFARLGLVVSVVVGALTLIAYLSVPEALTFHDTKFYFRTAEASYASWDLWAGRRPVLPSLLFKVCNDDVERIRIVQTLLSAGSFILLTVAVVGATRRPWVRWFGAALVVSVGLCTEVLKWNHAVLSESVAISALALFVAAWIRVARGLTRLRLAALVFSAALYSFARDSGAYVVLVVGLAILCWATFGLLKRKAAKWEPFALGSALVVVFMLNNASADRGGRWAYPLMNVIVYRVVKDEAMTAWFREDGMPEVKGKLPRAAYRSPDFADFRHWLNHDGKRSYVKYLLTQPGYLLGRPAAGLGDVLGGKSGSHSKHPPWTLPLFDAVWRRAYWPAHLFLSFVTLTLAWSTRALWSPLFLIGASAMILVYPHAVVVWHGDAIELSRHGLLVWVQMALGLVLMIAASADSLEIGKLGSRLRGCLRERS